MTTIINTNNDDDNNTDTSNNSIILAVMTPNESLNTHQSNNEEDMCCTNNVGVENLTTTAASTSFSSSTSCLLQLQDNTATDSGRESVNEFDSSLEETQMQLSKKPCIGEFYATKSDDSSGNGIITQTKWYLKSENELEDTVAYCQSVNFIEMETKDVIQTSTTLNENNKNGQLKISNISDNETNMRFDDGSGDTNASQVSTAALFNLGNVTEENRIVSNTVQTNDIENCVISNRIDCNTNLSLQIRAVSSPSLTDALQDNKNYTIIGCTSGGGGGGGDINGGCQGIKIQLKTTSIESSISNDPSLPPSYNTTMTNTNTSSSRSTNSSNKSSNLTTSHSVGVLQKFKRTLTNFNKTSQQQQYLQVSNISNSMTNNASRQNALATASTNGTVTEFSHDVTDSTSGKYRFGPLIWRSSKERRKTKFNRRDKCNSGDSGIQIELENDETFTRAIATTNGGVNSAGTSSNVSLRSAANEESPKMRSIRRTNSAKATTISDQTYAALYAKEKVFNKIEIYGEREAPESLPTRSLSQPNGLETFGICRNDIDESDSDSVASHDEAPNFYAVYAEVLYNFTAAGPQELGLERGQLIEILRKEVGPWWFGRIKKEDASLFDEILDPDLGWFPKEFVRIIQCPETDAFFLRNLRQLQQDHQHQQQLQQQVSTLTTSSSVIPIAAAKITTILQPQDAKTAAKATIAEAEADDDVDVEVDVAVDENNVTTIVIESPSLPSNVYISNINTNVKTSENANENRNTSGNPIDSNNTLVPSRIINVIMDNADILRRSAVKELLDTEVNYVKLLASICEGYLPAMSKRIDIFTPNSIRLIFSNINTIYKFQRKFLEALRKGIEQNQIAKVFLKMHKGFLCYSTYCNAYPRALIELESYDRIKDAKIVLDNCREAENLAELPLSAHLLAPVQRICRYPLHLNEIMKSAPRSSEPPAYDAQEVDQHDASQLDLPDTRETIDMALEAMKGITEAVNEGKRHSETIARHQASFQNFKGPPLHLHSTRFFLQIDATRQKQNLWNSSCTLFLFDNQLIYCKRDIIKRSQFIYKGRVFLDRCRVVNVRDGKMFGHTIKNSLRIYCEARDKWYDFSFRSANRKHHFLNTLALERQFSGKTLYVSEMTGFEYAFEERDFSDQSDYEMPESEGNGLVRFGREYIYDIATTTTGTSGDSSVPDSPAKSYKYSDTLPKKSTQSKDDIATGVGSELNTGSLGRRRIGNWFRKPKSTNSTPNHSPTHKPPPPLHNSLEFQIPTGMTANEMTNNEIISVTGNATT